MRKYYTLAVRLPGSGQKFTPQFGDYDRHVVAAERTLTKHEWPKGTGFVITCSGDTQAEIDHSIRVLNDWCFCEV